MPIDYAARAQALVGMRFRAQGRGPEGLDCIGVVLATFDVPSDSVRRDYQLRGSYFGELREQLDLRFRRVAKPQLQPGDVMLLSVADGRPHLAVRTFHGFVHAHAGLRRVVETPGMPEWPVIGVYRKRRSR